MARIAGDFLNYVLSNPFSGAGETGGVRGLDVPRVGETPNLTPTSPTSPSPSEGFSPVPSPLFQLGASGGLPGLPGTQLSRDPMELLVAQLEQARKQLLQSLLSSFFVR